MNKNNIASINKDPSAHQASAVTLSRVKSALDAWRAAKTKQNEKIPTHLWDLVFTLLQSEPESPTLAALSVTKPQYEKEKLARSAAGGASTPQVTRQVEPKVEPVAFCEAQKEPAIPLVYKPAQAFTTTTSVVELYRPDGMLMKIHLCTDRFDELLRAFFKG